jgi:XTP/dITP diphosphohydrolase
MRAKRKLLIATRNAGKAREYQRLLADLPLEITWPELEKVEIMVEETGATMAENAALKARAYATASGLLTWADDSGLEVDALAGEPGVRSARYAGPDASDEERCRRLLCQMENIPWEKRTARFRCVVAIAEPEGTLHFAEGVCEGIIALEPKGQGGFGYDPIFYLPDRGRTMAELSLEEKNQISHRARAALAARAILQTLVREGSTVSDDGQ